MALHEVVLVAIHHNPDPVADPRLNPLPYRCPNGTGCHELIPRQFKGGIVAREFLLKNGASEDQADSVCESIILHQDVWVKSGNISLNGQMIILATYVSQFHSSCPALSHYHYHWNPFSSTSSYIRSITNLDLSTRSNLFFYQPSVSFTRTIHRHVGNS